MTQGHALTHALNHKHTNSCVESPIGDGGVNIIVCKNRKLFHRIQGADCCSFVRPLDFNRHDVDVVVKGGNQVVLLGNDLRKLMILSESEKWHCRSAWLQVSASTKISFRAPKWKLTMSFSHYISVHRRNILKNMSFIHFISPPTNEMIAAI